jgi:hypothetical protein
VDEAEIHYAARRPRGNTDWPKTGIFTPRGALREPDWTKVLMAAYWEA